MGKVCEAITMGAQDEKNRGMACLPKSKEALRSVERD